MTEIEPRGPAQAGDATLALDAVLTSLAHLQRAQAALAALELDLLESARRWVDADPEPFGAGREMAYRALRADLATSLGRTERGVDRTLSDAYALAHELPATRVALHEGRIALRQAQVMVAETTGLEPDDRRAVETAALAWAHLAPPAFARKVRTLRERRSPETAGPRHRAAATSSDVTITPAPDGMAHLTAYLPATEAVAIHTRLDAAARSLRRHGDERPLGRLRAELFAGALLDDHPSAGADRVRFRGIRPTVTITVPGATLAGGDAPAQLEGYGPVDAETAREVASWAPFFRRLLTDPDTAAPVALGTTRYRPSDDLRLWLRIRDQHCGFPGCSRPALACDVDHTIAHEHGGATDHDNLAHLCRGHHRLKHHSRWNVTQAAGGSGRLTWRSPTGREHERVPELPP